MYEDFEAFTETRLASVDLVSCHWIYKIMHRANYSIELQKACLIAREYDIDYKETFAFVA